MEESAREKLEELIRFFNEQGLEELILEEGDLKVHLRRGGNPGPAAAPPAAIHANPGPVATASPPPLAPHLENISRTVAVRAPLIGVFYGSASPDSPRLVKIGDIVKEGQTVCIIEAMKVFNEIQSDWAGRVKSIEVENGALVQAGDPLVVLEFLDGR
jgi:acetyl-CoA carboxylase biotin carboxyl carrier protein